MPRYMVITIHIKIPATTSDTEEKIIETSFILDTYTGEIIGGGFESKEAAEIQCENENHKEENINNTKKPKNTSPYPKDIYVETNNKDNDSYSESDFIFEENTTEEISDKLKNKIKQKITKELNKEKNHTRKRKP
ncbi:hypothetical protein PEC302107_21030 [Pectobacterium araliae]|uniref:Uncharacterized protein n=1 Tax=Pectobacterium araliae TaxID=3073862 RepID=A0AAN0KB38_9GAMM|nr:hypothetical protein PEC302110_24840 [Pectobacterium sp. MAFF 302110]GKW20374.1 hypothetical protein PEC302107_21030 [Pectobacterium carotovorum subsp. carotovorum]